MKLLVEFDITTKTGWCEIRTFQEDKKMFLTVPSCKCEITHNECENAFDGQPNTGTFNVFEAVLNHLEAVKDAARFQGMGKVETIIKKPRLSFRIFTGASGFKYPSLYETKVFIEDSAVDGGWRDITPGDELARISSLHRDGYSHHIRMIADYLIEEEDIIG